MPLGSSINTLLLIAQNLNTNKPTNLIVAKNKNDKPFVFDSSKRIKSLERGSVEESIYSKEYIDSFFNELESDHSIRPNRILIIQGNKVIAERYNYPYVKNSWDCVFSTSKTIVALALGLLYDEGKVDLDKPVVKILGIEKKVNNKNKRITLRHLLTMSTGITFNEMETSASTKWIKSFFDSGTKFKLGTKFEYNSLNTYIVSVCVDKLAGKELGELVKERIFNPLDINDTYFDVSPEGHFKGGWGLYILPEDMGKIGIMIRDGGLYNGKRILSEEWINMMTHTQFEATKCNHILDYGFQMWVDDKKNFCVANGMYDQNIMIYRNSGTVLITACANNEAFHGSNLYKIAMKYFGSKEMGLFALCTHPGTRDLKNEEGLMYYFDQIKDKKYIPVNKICNSCGILPLLIQNELGTYVKGIKGVRFKQEGERYFFVVTENRKENELEFNFKNGVRKIYDFYGNLYDVSIDARFILSGKSEPFLVIRVFFLEFSSSRYFTVKFSKDSDIISLELSENPGMDFVNSIIEVQDENIKKLAKNVVKNINPATVSGTIKNIFSPSFMIVHGDAKIAKYRKLKKESEQQNKEAD